MKLQFLIIEGFKSFIQKQLFVFDLNPGFYFVAGNNQVEPNLGSNGAGKSSLFDALCWVLFGKTSTNLKAGNVVPWGHKTCKVTLSFDNHVLIRTQSPNTLTLDKQTITQEALEKGIGLDFTSFLYSILISQKGIKFFDLSPTEKMDVFSSIMENVVEKWTKYSEDCKSNSEIISENIIITEKDLSLIQGQVQGLRTDSLEITIKEWEDQRLESIEKAEKMILEYQKEVEDKNKTVQLLTKQIEKLTQKNDKVDTEVNEAQLHYTNSVQILSNKEAEIKVTQNDINHLQTELDKFKGMKNTCPYCGQQVTEQHINKETKKLRDAILLNRSCVAKSTEDLKSLQDKVYNDTKTVKNTTETLKKGQKDLQEATTNKRLLENTIQEYKKTLNTNTKAYQELKEQVNPYLTIKEKNQRKIVFLNRRIMYLSLIINNLNQEKEILDFWKKGFKEIRLMVIEEAIKDLEIQINNNLQQLGLLDWEIVLDIERETKRGTTLGGFTVKVLSPYNTELVPFESWSGGEGQRLRLAGTLGLIDFIQDRKGIDWNIEIYDEPSQFLSEEGIEDLLENLNDRARSTQKIIFIVDQRSLHTRGEFSGMIEIVKDKDGSQICVAY